MLGHCWLCDKTGHLTQSGVCNDCYTLPDEELYRRLDAEDKEIQNRIAREIDGDKGG